MNVARGCRCRPGGGRRRPRLRRRRLGKLPCDEGDGGLGRPLRRRPPRGWRGHDGRRLRTDERHGVGRQRPSGLWADQCHDGHHRGGQEPDPGGGAGGRGRRSRARTSSSTSPRWLRRSGPCPCGSRRESPLSRRPARRLPRRCMTVVPCCSTCRLHLQTETAGDVTPRLPEREPRARPRRRLGVRPPGAAGQRTAAGVRRRAGRARPRLPGGTGGTRRAVRRAAGHLRGCARSLQRKPMVARRVGRVRLAGRGAS